MSVGILQGSLGADDHIWQGLEAQGENVDSPLTIVKNPHSDSGGNRWHVQSNIRAHSEAVRHTILWADKIVDDIDEQVLYTETGSKSGRGFIGSLEMGDRIAVIARAKVGFRVPHCATPSNSDENLIPVSRLEKLHWKDRSGSLLLCIIIDYLSLLDRLDKFIGLRITVKDTANNAIPTRRSAEREERKAHPFFSVPALAPVDRSNIWVTSTNNVSTSKQAAAAPAYAWPHTLINLPDSDFSTTTYEGRVVPWYTISSSSTPAGSTATGILQQGVVRYL